MGLIAGVAAVSAAPASAQATLDTVKKRGKILCGVSPVAPGFSYADDKGVRRGFDVGHLPRGVGRRLRRSRQGRVRPAQHQRPLPGAAVRRNRHPVAPEHLELLARHLARPRFRPGGLLRRPGPDGAEQAQREERRRACRTRRSACCRARRRCRTWRTSSGPRRQVRIRGVRELRRMAQRLLQRPLRRHHYRPLGPRLRARHRQRSRRTTWSCPRRSPRSRSLRRSARTIRTGATS